MTYAALLSTLDAIDSAVWGGFMMFLLIGTGIYLTIRTRAVQLRLFPHAIDLVSGKFDDPDEKGEITHFQALSSALSATIGTGNIAGVATAIAAGGPGAVVWMWITAFFGMCSKFACCSLAQKFRRIAPDGEVSGGPMYYLSMARNLNWPKEFADFGKILGILGWLFAFFTMTASFGIGNMVQANSVAEPLYDLFKIPKAATGALLAVLTGLVIIGGIRRIATVASKIVPLMCVVYVSGALWILFRNAAAIPGAFKAIFLGVVNPTAAVGGVAGYTVMKAMQFGVARGLFSNEAGLGSAAIAHAPAKTNEPIREGLVAMLGPFIDTIVVCTMTALVIIISGPKLYMSGVTGATLSSKAFEAGLPGGGGYIVSFGIVFFAYSTIISWSYYGDRAAEFIFGHRAVKIYRWLYIVLIPVGAMVELKVVWTFSDIMNGCMAFPNLVALVLLAGWLAPALADYEDRCKTGLVGKNKPKEALF